VVAVVEMVVQPQILVVQQGRLTQAVAVVEAETLRLQLLAEQAALES
jgi:hypothetical protein